MKLGKRILSLLVAVALLVGMTPTAIATGVEETPGVTPSANWTMQTVDGQFTASGSHQVYKMVGHVNSPKGIQTLETWLTYDNTTIVPVDPYDWTDISIDAASKTQYCFDVLLETGGRSTRPIGIMANGWYVNDAKTTWYVTLGEATVDETNTPNLVDAVDCDYLEFYFRIADGKSLENFDSTTFTLYNSNNPTRGSVCTLMDATGTQTEYYQYNVGADSALTDDWNVTLTYTNSTVTPTYDVTVHYTDGEGTAQTAAVAVARGSSPTAADLAQYENGYTSGGTGYAFSHWSLSPEGTAAELSAITAATTLYAVYTPTATTYTVSFDNGTTVATATVAPGAALTAADFPADPVKTGHVFLGWFTGVTGGTDGVVAIGDSASGRMADTATPVTADATYTPLWAPDSLLAAVWQYGETDEVYVYSTPAQVQTIVNEQRANSAKVKLYQNADLGTITAHGLTIASGKTLELDLNGKTLSAATSTASTRLIHVEGTLSIFSSATAKGEIVYSCGAGNCAAIYLYAKDAVKGTVSLIDNVAVTAAATSITPECFYAASGTTAGVVKNSTFTANGGRAFYIGTSVPVERIENCSFSGGHQYAVHPVTIDGTVGVIKDCEFSSNHTTSYSSSRYVLSVGGRIGTMENCTISSSIIHGLGLTVQMANPTIEKIINCTVSSATGNGVKLNAHARIGSISGTTITGGANGVVVEQSVVSSTMGSTQTAGIDSLNATVDGGSGYALWVYGGSDVTVTGGRYKGAAGILSNTAEGVTMGQIAFSAGNVLGSTADGEGYYGLVAGFTVNYMCDGILLEQDFCQAGTVSVYDAATPTRAQTPETTYTFAHWATEENGTVAVDPATITANATLYAVFAAAPRSQTISVTDAGEANGAYTTVKGAVEAIAATAAKTGTITLTADNIEGESSAISAGEIVLELNGYTLTNTAAAHGFAVTGGGKLTIRSTVEGGSYRLSTTTSGANAVYVEGESAFTLESGSIVCGNLYAINTAGGTITMKGGYVESASEAVHIARYPLTTQTAPTLEFVMTGGTLKSTGKDALTVSDGGNATISGGSLLSEGSWNAGLKTTGAGTVKISGDAHLQGSAYGANLFTFTTVLISGGSFESAYRAVNIDSGAKNDVQISGGRFKGQSTAELIYDGTGIHVVYATGCALSATPDADGFYRAVTTVAPSIESTDAATVTATVETQIPENTGEVVIEAVKTDGAEDVTKGEVTFSQTVAATIANASSITVATNVADVTLDSTVLNAIQDAVTAAAAPVTLVAEKKTVETLPASQQAAVASEDAVIIDLTLQKNGVGIDFNGGAATIKVPFALPTGTSASDFGVFYIDNQGNKERVPSVWADGYMSFTATHFSLYTVDSNAVYHMTVRTDKAHYNVGDTVTATITATGDPATYIGSFGFTPSYDTQKLTLGTVSVTEGFSAVNPTTGKTGYVYNGATGLQVDATGVVIATITFTATAAGAASITLTDVQMTEYGYESNPVPVVTAASPQIHDLQVTLTAENGTVNGGGTLTLYARYDEAGLYSDAARTQAATVTTAAAVGYRLADEQWQGNGANTYADFTALAALSFTQNQSFSLRTVKTYTISFTQGDNGQLGSTTAITVDTGTALKDVTLPTATGDTGYAFSHWVIGNETVTLATYTVTGDITLKPVYAPRTFSFTPGVSTEFTVGSIGGLNGDNRAVYGTDVTFTVTPTAGYAVRAVRYKVGEGQAQTITPDSGGTYTIPGAAILGDVTLEIDTVQYHTITLSSGAGATLTAPVTVYTPHGQGGLYTDTACLTALTALPTPTAAAGYRLATDTAAEPLWFDGSTGYTSAALTTAAFTANAALTPQGVKQWTIHYVAGANGALAASATDKTVDAGTTVDSLLADMPGTEPNAGYVFDSWTHNSAGGTITADTTFTANFKHGQYTISFPQVTGVSFQTVSGIANGVVTHGTDAKFTMTVSEGYRVDAVKYTVGGATQTLTPDGETYTIPGADITGNVVLGIEGVETVKVTFTTDGNGTVGGQTTVEQVFSKDYILQAGDIPTPEGNPGYTFKQWQTAGGAATPAGTQLTADTTFTAVFDHASYEVSVTGGAIITGTTATHGTDFIFTPTVSGGLVTGVSVSVEGTGDVVVTANADGSYTLSGESITGKVTITPTILANTTLDFITRDTYKALAQDTQIVLLRTAELDSGRYLLGESPLFWSGKYNAYVAIVDDSLTPAALAALLKSDAEAVVELAYDGDVNLDGRIDPNDGCLINQALHEVTLTESDRRRLEMDVNGDGAVTTADITLILNIYVGNTTNP